MLTEGQLATAAADIRYCLTEARAHTGHARTARPLVTDTPATSRILVGIRRAVVAYHLNEAGRYRREAVRIRTALRAR